MDTKQIPLRRRSGEIVGWTTVSACDYDKLIQYSWSLDAEGYARSHRMENGELITGKMHRMVGFALMGLNRSKVIDHINRDRLDNRRDNLRSATRQQQACNCSKQKNNKSGFIGVFWSKKDKKYLATIGYECKLKYLGLFDDKYEAARVRDAAAIELHGEFAVLNFPEEAEVAA